MPRTIRLFFPNSNIEVVATMLEKDAPDTCDMVWAALEQPLQVVVRHPLECGPELWIPAPRAPDLPLENATVFPIPGELLYYQFEGLVGYFEGVVPRDQKVSDIGMYYGRGGRSFIRLGWVPGNLFARVSRNLEGLVVVAGRVEEAGPQPVIVERLRP